jgi:phage FluMu protein Com
MEIIKKGTLPGDVHHTITCFYCKTVFKFKTCEGDVFYDPREGYDCIAIKCPLCNKINYT